MLPDIRRAAEILRGHGATEVYLFGSRARGDARADSDIDLAVRGIPSERFYRAVGDALCSTDLLIDLVDLDAKGPLMDLLRKEGDFRNVPI
ncbi:hypothetical protein BH09SUM1_BH09SUM1_23230 [soil metagenome]